ncbi:Hsp20/alpha crystallin family protein [Paraliomyxa miuraensis]|uniref:Hsp20/alpha crystallin family protein n=1 Tax=Paraliomyxa miuraensis TaxID=376150 RepID=UPI002252E9B6|nr:Hsp20/alpha crystallin family protein [Paraliomyxa miuraensis]MCX4245040.1 Hsp20/alpha crystallin family protein [Paraliomyxa miuraensis]
MTNPNDDQIDTRPVHEVGGERPVLAPAVDIFENAEEYRLVADLPGVRREDVGIDLERGELTVFAKRDVIREGEALALSRREGDFRRVFRIPEEVDAGRVEASLDDGVLQVRLPKSERAKPRRISVKAVA